LTDAIYFESQQAFRHWLLANHDRAEVLEVGYYKKSAGKPSITYKESVDEALCFGWIDGVRHTVDAERYTNRFTPRKPRSNWSAVNLKRFDELLKLGRVHESGMRTYEQRVVDVSPYSYERNQGLEEPYLSQFQTHEKAWAFFSAQPQGYRRTCGSWVMSAKREETRQKRLRQIVELSEARKRLNMLAPAKS
jgi:uncharacterized protein YdeI (YjbR/CyaY-like superfamily)